MIRIYILMLVFTESEQVQNICAICHLFGNDFSKSSMKVRLYVYTDKNISSILKRFKILYIVL